MPNIHPPSTHDKTSVEVYQLRIWLKKISPSIWRRILIRSDSSIADLHYILQIAMGWSDTYLHQFVIHGKKFGIAKNGGMYFPDNPKQVLLQDLRFRLNQRFIYEYNFFDSWVHEIRVEKCIQLDPIEAYPVCIGGSRAVPPEDCGGPSRFMELRDEYL